jgi:hypothetical protein
MSNTNQTDTMGALSVDFVQPSYFLGRIQQFEIKYKNEYNGWGEFLSAYSKGQVDRDNSDFDEWAFLCEHFMENLIESGDDVGPPGAKGYAPQKPESDSGFFFLESKCSMRRATLRLLVKS